MYVTGANLQLGKLDSLLPLLAIIIGFIPGCGPQIITTSLYLAGVIPFSAQIGNAISNVEMSFPCYCFSTQSSVHATLCKHNSCSDFILCLLFHCRSTFLISEDINTSKKTNSKLLCCR